MTDEEEEGWGKGNFEDETKRWKVSERSVDSKAWDDGEVDLEWVCLPSLRCLVLRTVTLRE